MPGTLSGKTIAILATDGVERVELEQPREAMTAAGASVVLLSLQQGSIQSMDSDINKARTFDVDRVVTEDSDADFDALILPGGTVNPDTLRQDATAVSFVRRFFTSGKPIAAICHGPWTLVEAGVVNGMTLTSFPSIRTDIKNAGGNPVDEQVSIDRGLITSRNPDDLDAFCEATVQVFSQGRYSDRPGA